MRSDISKHDYKRVNESKTISKYVKVLQLIQIIIHNNVHFICSLCSIALLKVSTNREAKTGFEYSFIHCKF